MYRGLAFFDFDLLSLVVLDPSVDDDWVAADVVAGGCVVDDDGAVGPAADDDFVAVDVVAGG